ncbi:hypothetical protein [Bacillus fonticola]|uniref:hypothetical protein n=1 Tax=Bacillus fonticola TaxID=2728853 RepID=UPI0014763009|nr:hypothetical protein [Bacillus fonticola]
MMWKKLISKLYPEVSSVFVTEDAGEMRKAKQILKQNQVPIYKVDIQSPKYMNSSRTKVVHILQVRIEHEKVSQELLREAGFSLK